MGITETIATVITAFMQHTGYISVYILMTMESMVFPIPSEAVMPFAGFLISMGTFSWWGVVLVSSMASLTGSLVSYAMGYYGGEPFIRRVGRYLLLNEHDLQKTHAFFAKRGEATIFICRFIPVVRHLISIPAGMGQMRLLPFMLYTVVGATAWNTFLAWVGFILKENWKEVMSYSHLIDKGVLVILVGLVGWFYWKHIKKSSPSV